MVIVFVNLVSGLVCSTVVKLKVIRQAPLHWLHNDTIAFAQYTKANCVTSPYKCNTSVSW